MSKRPSFELTVVLILVGVGLAKIPDVLAVKADAYSFFDTIVDVRTELSRFYVEEPDSDKMLRAAVEGMVESLEDPYTNYFSPEDLDQFDKQTRGSFSGIGAEITTESGHLQVVTPIEDSPAFEAGIMAGDAILEIDGQPTEGLSVQDAVAKITGPEGTKVTLKVRHTSGEEKVFEIIRRQIKIQTVKGFSRDAEHHWDFMLDAAAKVGYIRLTQFSDPTAEALAQAIADLRRRDAKAIILDLRFNPGGLLDQAIVISDMFLDAGRIVSTKGRNSPERSWDAEQGTATGEMPILVMVNEYSASASEILSGALKDNDRAAVLGTRTFGKGSVQQVLALQSGNGAVKVTTAHYYLPSGRNLHKRPNSDVWGVDPSDGLYVPMTPDQIIAMNEVRRDADVVQNGNPKANGDVAAPERITPDWVRETRKDHQLAAALETTLARIESGQWKKVGQSNATLLAFLSEKSVLEKRRDALQELLLSVNADIEKLQQKIDGKAEEPAPVAPEPTAKSE